MIKTTRAVVAILMLAALAGCGGDRWGLCDGHPCGGGGGDNGAALMDMGAAILARPQPQPQFYAPPMPTRTVCEPTYGGAVVCQQQ
jgi:hypothetical protein